MFDIDFSTALKDKICLYWLTFNVKHLQEVVKHLQLPKIVNIVHSIAHTSVDLTIKFSDHVSSRCVAFNCSYLKS